MIYDHFDESAPQVGAVHWWGLRWVTPSKLKAIWALQKEIIKKQYENKQKYYYTTQTPNLNHLRCVTCFWLTLCAMPFDRQTVKFCEQCQHFF